MLPTCVSQAVTGAARDVHGAVVDATNKVATHTTAVAGKIRQTFGGGSPERGASEKASLLGSGGDDVSSSPRTDAGTFSRPYED